MAVHKKGSQELEQNTAFVTFFHNGYIIRSKHLLENLFIIGFDDRFLLIF